MREEVDVAHVVRLEDDGHRRRVRVEPIPDLGRVLGRSERVDESDLAAGLDDRRGDERLPVVALVPGRVLDPPDPEPRRDIPNLGHGYEPSMAISRPASARVRS